VVLIAESGVDDNEEEEISSSVIYSVILGFLRDPMRFFVPPHQN